MLVSRNFQHTAELVRLDVTFSLNRMAACRRPDQAACLPAALTSLSVVMKRGPLISS